MVAADAILGHGNGPLPGKMSGKWPTTGDHSRIHLAATLNVSTLSVSNFLDITRADGPAGHLLGPSDVHEVQCLVWLDDGRE